MRTNGIIFGVVAAFTGIAAVIYYLWAKEPTGTTALAFGTFLSFMISYYLLFTARRLGPQIEDDPEGNVEDAAGEVGFFSPHSKWPFFAGIGAAIAILGVIFGWWLFAIGLIVGLTSAFGMLFEYYITDLRTRVRVDASHH